MSQREARSAIRRYPALAYLAGAVALALLLPSGLNVPNSGPSSLAEYSPVPGQSNGSGSMSELGQGSSGAIGFGSTRTNATATTAPADPTSSAGTGRIVRKAGTKRCVGKPARQTEDPLSPPCVAYFDGDNFGATAKGVTKDEVTVVLPVSTSSGSSLPSTDRHEGQLVDCAGGPTSDDTADDSLCRGFMRFFNDRYQTYNRVVHLFMPHHIADTDVDARLHPFAFIGQGLGTSWAARKTVSVAYGASSRKTYQQIAPYGIGFRNDMEDSARLTATYVCTRLKGKPARYSGNLTDLTTTRKFGLWMELGAVRDSVVAALKDQCGITFDSSTQADGYQPADSSTPARMRTAGVTTVIAYNNSGMPIITNYATQNGWFPEWVIPASPAARNVDSNFYGRLPAQNQWSHAFGVTLDYRRDAVNEQQWYRAYRENCGACPEPTALGFSAAAFFYDELEMLFYGIQAAGPRLTPENIDKGLHAIPPVGSSDPYRPAAYFSPGNFTYVKDATAIWWDPSGVPPGSSSSGCYRLVQSGRRYRAGEWPVGDGDVSGHAGDPCQGDQFSS